VVENVFSRQGKEYRTSRPAYPSALFEYLISLCRERQMAWDCATGNGQVAIELAKFFNQVIATDISKNQICSAVPASNIEYRICKAEKCSLDNETIDFIAVGQGASWLNMEEFYIEVKRIARKDCILALFGFREIAVDEGINSMVDYYLQELVGKDWPGGKELNDSQYQNLPFPFDEIISPKFKIEIAWTADEALRLLDSYSGGQTYFERTGLKASSKIKDDFIRAWGGCGVRRKIAIPIYMRVGKVR
jgi:hypothetical protein